MKETCYRVKMTGCRVKIKTGLARVEKKVQKGGEKGILRLKKRFRGLEKREGEKKHCSKGEKKGAPWPYGASSSLRAL